MGKLVIAVVLASACTDEPPSSEESRRVELSKSAPSSSSATLPANPPLVCPTPGGCCALLPDETAMSNCFIAQVLAGQCGQGSCRRADCSIAIMQSGQIENPTVYCRPKP